jgi:hypothetical protein
MAIYVIVEDEDGIGFEYYHVSCLFSLIRGVEGLKYRRYNSHSINSIIKQSCQTNQASVYCVSNAVREKHVRSHMWFITFAH